MSSTAEKPVRHILALSGGKDSSALAAAFLAIGFSHHMAILLLCREMNKTMVGLTIRRHNSPMGMRPTARPRTCRKTTRPSVRS